MKYNAKENDNFKNAKIFKIYEDLINTRDVVYIGSTCDTLKKCMTNVNIKSKSRVNWARDKFYMMILSSIRMCVYIYIICNYIHIHIYSLAEHN